MMRAGLCAPAAQDARVPRFMGSTFLALVLAAALEIGGDALIRTGLVRSAWPWIAFGAAALIAYGLLVNVDQTIEFSRLMGVYIAIFFVVSQGVAFVFFSEAPSLPVLLGGILIVSGGIVIQLGPRLLQK